MNSKTISGSSSSGKQTAKLREQMIERHLRARGIQDPRVLDAMSRVNREEFVPAAFQDSAYEDSPLPIGCGQTISQPFTVAFMCQALRLEGTEKVLEIGTGSGYGAAVLAHLAKTVHSIEYVPPLAKQAQARLERLGYKNVHVRVGDGTLGLAEEAPFDAIVVTAGAKALPLTYIEQLGENGRLVIPLGSQGYGQTLYCFVRSRGKLSLEDLGGFVFVPLVGRFGVSEVVGKDVW